MHGNGQAQSWGFRSQAGLAQPAVAGYPVHENHKQPLSSFATLGAPQANLYRVSQMSHHSMTMNQALPFSTALLLVSTEANASVDKRALRHAGVATVRVFTSGLAAARLLAGLNPDPQDDEPMPEVVLCHSTLADMSGADFVALIRCHPQLLDLPIITLASNADDAQKISALASGYSALLVRPYAPPVLHATLLEVARNAADANYTRTARQNLRCGDFDKALAQYTLLGHTQEDPEQAYHAGMHYLLDRQWDQAIRAFQKALRHITLKGESELGLATAWKGKGDLERYRHYLGEASRTFARALQWQKARSVYARLLQEDPTAASPFLHMAECLIREGRFDEATEALAAGYDLNPQTPVARAVARACLYTDTPEYAARRVEESLSQTRMGALAPRLGEEIRTSLQDEEQKLHERQRTATVQDMLLLPTLDDSADLFVPPLPRKSSTARQETPQGRPRKGISLRDTAPDTLVLTPLNPEDAETSLFYNMPGLNEALSVAKFTWKLFHASKP
ncbi:MAG: tetratricopeptide repeat protein [Desulfovibrionaceae bacterium]